MEQRGYHTTTLSSRSLERLAVASHRDELAKHPATSMAYLYSKNKQYIPPTWNKITKTPWTDKAKICGGHGYRMKAHIVSDDAPDFFKTNISNNKTDTQSTVRPQTTGTYRDTSYHVIAGGENLLKTVQSFKEIPKPRVMKINFKNQVLFETVPELKPNQPIDWDGVRTSQL